MKVLTNTPRANVNTSWKRRALRTAGLFFAAYFAIGGGFVMLFEDSFIYLPTKGSVGTSPGEDVFLTASDGVRIHGWHVANPKAAMSILWFHGNAGNLEDRRDMLRDLRELPASVLVIDYRGYGKSEGTPSEEGLNRDARAAWDWLSARTAPEKIVILGKSLGGGPACELASQVKCGGLILQSAFTSAPDMAWRVLPLFPARFFMRTRFDNLAKVRNILCPKLFVHSEDDEVIPFSMAEKLYAGAAEPKECAWFDGAGHNDLWVVHSGTYYACLARFLKLSRNQ